MIVQIRARVLLLAGGVMMAGMLTIGLVAGAWLWPGQTASASPASGGLAPAATTKLELQVAELQALLEGFSRETVHGHDTVRLSGANLQIVNGTGLTTGPVNGVGNLILGYDTADVGDQKSASHSLIVGDDHSYSAAAGVVFGRDNTISSGSATVLGGLENIASGTVSSVVGGRYNDATSTSAVVVGGKDNTASSAQSVAVGGEDNNADQSQSVVVGGQANVTAGYHSVIVGGENNDTAESQSVVVGGQTNGTFGEHSVVVGGENNYTYANATHTVITGGLSNQVGIATGDHNVLSGGDDVDCPFSEKVVCGELLQSLPDNP